MHLARTSHDAAVGVAWLVYFGLQELARFPNASSEELVEITRRAAEVNEAVHILTDPIAKGRHDARVAREQRGRATPDEPGRDGVRFTASSPGSDGGVGPSRGDPDFDYRERVSSEFDIAPTPDPPPPPPPPWTARPKRRRWR